LIKHINRINKSKIFLGTLSVGGVSHPPESGTYFVPQPPQPPQPPQIPRSIWNNITILIIQNPEDSILILPASRGFSTFQDI